MRSRVCAGFRAFRLWGEGFSAEVLGCKGLGFRAQVRRFGVQDVLGRFVGASIIHTTDLHRILPFLQNPLSRSPSSALLRG